jgi:hypothetical protein
MTACWHERSECAYKKFDGGECHMDRKFDLRDNAFVTDICKLNIDYESAQSPGSLPVCHFSYISRNIISVNRRNKTV